MNTNNLLIEQSELLELTDRELENVCGGYSPRAYAYQYGNANGNAQYTYNNTYAGGDSTNAFGNGGNITGTYYDYYFPY